MKTKEARSRRRRPERGLAMVEAAFVLPVIFAMFFGFLQGADLYAAKLQAQGAAMCAARAAAVTRDDGDFLPKEEGKNDHAEALEAPSKAARIFLGYDDPAAEKGGSWEKTAAEATGPTKEFDLVNVTLKAEYNCGIPLGNVLVCGADRKRTIEVEAQFPHQSGRYTTAAEGF